MSNGTIAMERAQEALGDRIRKLSEDATPEQVKLLAEAFSLVTHGPQGGNYDSDVDTKTDYRSNQICETDYHYTTHNGDSKGQIGFSFGGRQT